MILDTIKRMLGRIPPGGITCEEALARIQEYIDGELEATSSEAVEEHFRVCARCYPHLKLEQRFKRRVAEALSAQNAPEDLRARVLRVLEEEGEGRET